MATTFIFIKDGGVVVLTSKKKKCFESVSLGFRTRCVTLEKPVKLFRQTAAIVSPFSSEALMMEL